jgi:hypothetical protein
MMLPLVARLLLLACLAAVPLAAQTAGAPPAAPTLDEGLAALHGGQPA